MKKTNLIVAVMLAAFAFTSCKKDETETDETSTELTFANLSVEENKKALEQNGIEFVNHINSLPDEKFISALESFAKISDRATGEIPFEIKELGIIGDAAKAKNLVKIFDASTSLNSSINKLGDYYGTYTWNASNDSWTKVSSNSKLEIKFPSVGSSTNNVTFTASYVASGKTATIDGETFELPSSATASLVVDGKEELKLTSTYQYLSDGSPSLVDLKLVFGSFSLTTNVTSDSKKGTYTFSLNKGNVILLEAAGGGNGNANISKIENAEDVDDLLENANSIVSLMNIQFVGNVDVKSIATELDKANGLSDKAYSQKEAELYNKYAEAYAIYKKEKTLIAKIAYESVEESYSYQTYYDDNGQYLQIPRTITYYYYNLEPKLVFKDGSKISFESFTDTGFSQIIDKLESLADRMEAKLP
ncbi:hypothetical protein [Pedobacter xixiisoli]|nr:hypothetical protein [Pedobacter xixiisoli]